MYCVQDIGCMHEPYNDELSNEILSPIGGLVAFITECVDDSLRCSWCHPDSLGHSCMQMEVITFPKK